LIREVVGWIRASNPPFRSHGVSFGMVVCLSAKPPYEFCLVYLLIHEVVGWIRAAIHHFEATVFHSAWRFAYRRNHPTFLCPILLANTGSGCRKPAAIGTGEVISILKKPLF